MKWSKKGQELDGMAKDLMQLFCHGKKKLYIFGAGLIGVELKAVFERTGYFSAFIDNNKEKQKIGVDGAKVFSLQEYLEEKEKGIIIIAADKRNIPSMIKQLSKASLKIEKDFFIYSEFMEKAFPVLLLYEKNKLYADLVQICLTERCSLKCRKCAHACYAVSSDARDLEFETAKKSADAFFEKVDLVREFVLIGGEPFLYQRLAEVIGYIGEHYRENMVTFSITTNGTILPGQDVLNMCEKYRVLIRISNYSGSVKWLKEKYGQLEKKLDENQIPYVLSDAEHPWMDYGFETVDRGWNAEELTEVFDKCRTPCREIRGSRYYYCVMARSVSENLGFGVGEEDYLDLEHLGRDGKKVLLEFQMGYSEKGYLDMCNHCNGAEAVNYPIPVAEQM